MNSIASFSRRRLLLGLFFLSNFQAYLQAQPAPVTVGEAVITLNPFVHATKHTGHGAQNPSSSSRLNLSHVNVPQTVSVATSE